MLFKGVSEDARIIETSRPDSYDKKILREATNAEGEDDIDFGVQSQPALGKCRNICNFSLLRLNNDWALIPHKRL